MEKGTTMQNCFKQISAGLHTLCIFRGLLADPAVKALLALADAGPAEKPGCYAAFAEALYRRNPNWSQYLLNAVMEDENVYMLRRAEGKPIDPVVEECAAEELAFLQRLAQLEPELVKSAVGFEGFLPRWQTEKLDFPAVYADRLAHIAERGYGIFARYTTFIIRDGVLVPVKHPDAISLSSLSGYQQERQAVISNTLALAEGRPAANVLLYGDAGTGKSSTVKAVANEYSSRGLRLIELKKNQLHQIPHLVDRLTKNPLKFILFIDDLSFTRNDDDFAALKAILEGSVSARANNLAIYATSNRRHLIKESFSDREGDDIHRGDTMEELISLSDRFGLTITFQKPKKQLYLDIVHSLAQRYGVALDEKELDLQAEAFAIQRGGRSPRAARQFIENLAARGTESTRIRGVRGYDAF